MALGSKDGLPETHTGYTYKGEEIVISKTRGRPFSGLVAKGMEKGIFPEQKKIEVTTLYAALGNIAKVAELSKVPAGTIQTWRKQPWFQELLREIRTENNEKIDAKFTEIVESALEQISDRVSNGDYHVLRDGSLVRRPVSAKDLSLVAAINVDKRQLLRGEPTSRSEAVGSVEEKQVSRLEKLAETFEGLAKHGRVPQLIEGQVEDAQILPGPDGRHADEATPEGHKNRQIQEGKQ